MLHVADLARSLDFYRHRLGFDLAFDDEDSYACVSRSGCMVHLKRSPPRAGERPASEVAESIDVCFGSSAVEALAAEFGANGVPFAVPLRAMPYGKEFYVRDPDGYVLAFVSGA